MSQLTICIRSVKNASILVAVFPYLLSVLRAKKSCVVKARDLSLYLGINDHGLITAMGKLLSWLVREGYAIKLNKSRPIRYRLTPEHMWKWIIKNCKSKCRTCIIAKTCPYRKLTTTYRNRIITPIQGEKNE